MYEETVTFSHFSFTVTTGPGGGEIKVIKIIKMI